MVFTVHVIYTYLYKYNKNNNTLFKLTIYWLLPIYLQLLASSSNRTFTNDYKKKKKNHPMLACFNSLLLNEFIHFFAQHY